MSYLSRLRPSQAQLDRDQRRCEEVRRQLQALVERLEHAVDRMSQNHL